MDNDGINEMAGYHAANSKGTSMPELHNSEVSDPRPATGARTDPHWGETIRPQISGIDPVARDNSILPSLSVPTPLPNVRSGEPIELDQAPTRIAQSDAHLEYVKVSTRNAKCDQCEKRNTTSMQKCVKCGVTTCESCHEKGRYDRRHNLSKLDLDWSLEPRGRGGKAKKLREKWNQDNTGTAGSGGQKGAVRLGRPPTLPDQMGMRRGLVRESVFQLPEAQTPVVAGPFPQANPHDSRHHTTGATARSLPNSGLEAAQESVRSVRDRAEEAISVAVQTRSERTALPTSPRCLVVPTQDNRASGEANPVAELSCHSGNINNNNDILEPTEANFRFPSEHFAAVGRHDMAGQYAARAQHKRYETSIRLYQEWQDRQRAARSLPRGTTQRRPGGRRGPRLPSPRNLLKVSAAPRWSPLPPPPPPPPPLRLPPPPSAPAVASSARRPARGAQAARNRDRAAYYAARATELVDRLGDSNNNNNNNRSSKVTAPQPTELRPHDSDREELAARLERDWNGDAAVRGERRENGPLAALELMEASVALEDMRGGGLGVPSWALWFDGMRVALRRW